MEMFSKGWVESLEVAITMVIEMMRGILEIVLVMVVILEVIVVYF